MAVEVALERRRRFLEMAIRRARPGSGSSREFLLRRTWSEPTVDLSSVSTPFVVVGAVATWLYMPERKTRDIDVLVLAADADRMARELIAAGCIERGRLSVGGTHWETPSGGELDVLEWNEPWIADALANPNRSPTGLPVIALPYLVLMKLDASRGQDLADLSRMLGQADEATRAAVRQVVGRYRPADLPDLESLIALGELEFQE